MPDKSLSEKRQAAGKAGYMAALSKHPDFHSLGGQVRYNYEMWSCTCHGIGLAAYISHPGNPLKGKKYRYLGPGRQKASKQDEV